MGKSIVVVCDKIHGKESDKKATDVYIWFSDDEARTFSEPVKTPAQGIVPDIKELKNGDWILTAHTKEGEKLVQYGWISNDRGKTWSDRIVVGADPRYNLCEASILECNDGTLISFMRENSFGGHDCIKTISHDGGYTWSETYNSSMTCCHRPTVGFLKDGRVLVTYRFYEGRVSGNTFLALMSEDCAKETERSNQKVRIMPLDYDRNTDQDGGYTDWVQFDDGEIYIVNYIKDDHHTAQIRGYSIMPEEIVI